MATEVTTLSERFSRSHRLAVT